jgi:arylsulfatase A-like enzyme
MALIDVAQSSVRQVPPRVGPQEALIASLHLMALYSLIGLVIGLGFGITAAWLRRTRVTSAMFRAAKGRGYWWQPDARGWSRGIAAMVASAVYFLVIARAYVVFTSTFHRADLAGLLLAGLALGVGWLALFSKSVVASWLMPMASRIGALASRASIAITFLLAALTGAVIFLARDTQVRLAYEPAVLALGPATLIVWFALWRIMARLSTRIRPRRIQVIAIVSCCAALMGLGWSANAFGASNRVRSVVEQRSVMGRRIVRLLQSMSDRDGDRYTWAFGGGDCDDRNATVHPGAVDVEGDGIDQDCFAGDGAPIIAPRGRGEFGRLPTGLTRPNVLVVTIDALRRDHLGYSGYERPTSPNIDRFAETAVDFARVVPQSSRSLRSIPSMWTGNFASEIAYGPEYLWPSLQAENVLAGELLRDRATYQTSAIMATEYFGRLEGFFQGFERVIQSPHYDPPREEAVDAALPELDRLHQTGSPWLLWVHLFNCHAPYLQDGVRSAYGSEQVDRYDTEIGFADQQFQRLVDRIEELGLRERTVIILASDHGEGFGEHGEFGHASTLYEEELRSVLMMRVPGVAARRVETPVGLLDVAPTILNLAGVSPSDDISGLSLLPFATGEREPDRARPLFAELLPDGLHPYDIKVLRRGDRKLMWWVRDGTFQYFDLSRDPNEHDDLSDARRSDAVAMLGELRAWVANASRAENRTDMFVDQNRLRSVPENITHPTDIRYPGRFTVVGFDLPRTQFTVGETVPLTFYYRVDGPIDRDLFFYVDIIGPPGVELPPHFHAWHYPLHSRYPTTRWVPGEIIRDPTPIVIPHELQVPIHLRISLRVRDETEQFMAEVSGEFTNSVSLEEIDVTVSTRE